MEGNYLMDKIENGLDQRYKRVNIRQQNDHNRKSLTI